MASKQIKGKTMTEESSEYAEQIKQEEKYKAKMFYYNDMNPTPIFDYEDIENDENFLVLCARAKPGDPTRGEDKCFVWHGSEHEVSSEEQNEFVQKCIGVYFGTDSDKKIKILQEHQADESPEFMLYFE